MAKRSPSGTPYSPIVVSATDLGILNPPDDDAERDDSALFISLVSIDKAVLSSVTPGDSVRIRFEFQPIPVETLEGNRVGNVTSRDEAAVKVLGRRFGVVTSVIKEPASCVVRIR